MFSLFFCASTSLFLTLSFFHFVFFFSLALSLSLSPYLLFLACNFIVFFFLSSLFLNFLPNQPQTCKIEKHYKTPPCRRTRRHIYIYIYAVKSIIGPSLAIFKVNNWAKSKSIIGPRSFSHYKNRGFRRFFCSVIIVCFLFPIISQFSKNSLFQKKGAKIGFFNFLCFEFKF